LLQTAFGSWRLALLAFFTLPSALVGGVLAAFATGGIISLGTLVGFFTVFGIAARNGIMLINHCQHLERQEGEPFGPGLVLRGARERLAPILMTALAAGLALIPLAISGDIPGHEIEHPMAIVILGGLVTSTILNLFIVPSLYLRFGKPGEKSEDSLFQSSAGYRLDTMLADTSSKEADVMSSKPAGDDATSTPKEYAGHIEGEVDLEQYQKEDHDGYG